MKLILTRHAKSSWDHAGLDDHDRPLNARGARSAPLIAAWLEAQEHVPKEVVHSGAARTRETWEGMATTFLTRKVRPEPSLYHASPSQMLGVLAGCTRETVMVIGHNPGIAVFAASLVAKAPDHARFLDFPTCATLVAEFDVSGWAEVKPGSGRALGFVIPRELE